MDKKYTSLEHSIRNIMTESISPIGTDEFKGTPKAFLKPAPRIAPKKGDTHPDGTAVLAQRGSAKIGQSKSGGTMSEEEILDEAEFKLPFETGLPSETDEKKKKKEEKEKIKVPTATELTMKDVNTSTVDKLLQKQKEKGKEVPGQQLPYWAKNDPEAWKKYQGELNPYKETPSELFKGKLTKALGDSKEAREKVEKLAKIGDVATGGLGGVVMSGADAIELAKQGRTKEALGKAKEFGIGAGTAALGGAVAGKIASKYAVPSLRGPFAPEAPKPADFDYITPPKGTGPGAKVRQDFAKADAEASKSTTQSQKYDVTGTRTEAPPKATAAKPDAKFYNPKTEKYYKSKPESDVATKEFDMAAAARKAGGEAQAKTQADISKPTKVKEVDTFEIAKPAISKGELVPTTIKPKVSTAAREPKEFKPSVSVKSKEPSEVSTTTAVADKTPIKFKIAEPETSKGALVVPKQNIPNFKIGDTAKIVIGNPPATTSTTAKEFQTPPKNLTVGPDIKVDNASKVKTATDTGVKSAAEFLTKVKPLTVTKQTTDTVTPTTTPPPSRSSEEKPPRRRGRLPFGLSLPLVNPQTLAGLRGFVPTTPYLHRADDYIREDNDADKIRRSIENVARPGGKTRLARQGEIKTKIIEDTEKKAELVRKVIADKKSTVNLKPKLKHPEVDIT